MLRNQNETRTDGTDKTSARLEADPLTFLAEDHMQQREICAMLHMVASQPYPEFRSMGIALAYLRHEFLLHNADERAVLFPMMVARCEKEDEIGFIVDRLLRDHEAAEVQAQKICQILESIMETSNAPDDANRAELQDFAGRCQRYLILENAIILRLARVRLTESDLEVLSRKMLLRRGLIEPDQVMPKEC
ncbi:MAG: hemerythrin domain-containing protein [Hyphomicrobiales bacterium]|jgi:hemerythrin-like domain-containing protein